MTRTKHIFPSSAKHKPAGVGTTQEGHPKSQNKSGKKFGKRVVGVPAGADTAEGPNGVANS